MCPIYPNSFLGTHPDAQKPSTQFSAHAQALLEEQREQNRHSPYVRSLMHAGPMVESTKPLPLNHSCPYLPGLQAQPCVVYKSQPGDPSEGNDLKKYRQAVMMGDLNAAHGTADPAMWHARSKPEVHEKAKKDPVSTPFSTRYRIRIQDTIDKSSDSGEEYSPKSAPRAVRYRGPPSILGPKTVTHHLHRPLRAQEQSDISDNEPEPSFGVGSDTSTRLSCTPPKAQDQPGLHGNEAKLASTVGPRTSTALSRDLLNAHEQPGHDDDDGSESSSCISSDTSTLSSRSSLKAQERPDLNDDDESQQPQSASRFLLSVLTHAAFLPAIYPTDKIILVKLGGRVPSRIVPMNMTAEARARVDAGNPFVEGLLTNEVNIKPRCYKGLAQIEQHLSDEVAKILVAESLADLLQYKRGEESQSELVAELEANGGIEAQVKGGMLEDKDAGKMGLEEDGSVKPSMPVQGMPAQAMVGSPEVNHATYKEMELAAIEKAVKIACGMSHLVLQDPVHTAADKASPKMERLEDQDWEMVEAEMEDVVITKEEVKKINGGACDQGWTLL